MSLLLLFKHEYWTPADRTTRLWLDASDTSPTNIIQSGGSVSQWSDKSGNDEHVLQGTAIAQPTTNLNTLNDLNVINFNGSNLLTALNTIVLPADFHCFAVARRTALGVSRMAGTWSNNNGDWTLTPDNDDDSRTMIKSDGSTKIVSTAGTDVVNYFIHEFRYTDNKSYNVLNGIVSSPLSVPFLGEVSTALFTVGATVGGGQFLTGDIAEIIVVNTAMTQGEINIMQNYLSRKWGIVI